MAFIETIQLSAKGVRYAVDKCVEEATKNGWNVCICVVNAAGHFQAIHRMDNVAPGPVDISIGKAMTAAKMSSKTKGMADAVGKRPEMGTVASYLNVPFLQGGVPIIRDKRCIGAIGVSGVTAEQDEQIAQAGVDALKNPPANL